MKNLMLNGLLITLIIIVLIPLNIANNNPEDFSNYNLLDFLESSMLFFATTLIAILATLSPAYFISKKFSQSIAIFILSFLILCGLYIPITTGKFDGVDEIIVSYWLLAFVIILSVIFTTAKSNNYRIFLYILLAGAGINIAYQSHLNYSFLSSHTSNNPFILSKDETNILVISFDALQANYISKIIQSNPKYQSIFDGFTNYENVVAVAPYTTLSTKITKLGYLPESASFEKLDTIRHRFITEKLFNKGYRVITYAMFNAGNSRNITSISRSEMAEKQDDHYLLALDSSFYRYIPFASKLANKMVGLVIEYQAGSNNQTSRYLMLKENNVGAKQNKTSIIEYDNFIKKITSQKIEPMATFQHYVFTHNPMRFNKDCSYISSFFKKKKQVTAIDETECAIKKMEELITKLKSLNLYNNSFIFFVSDHGYECAYNEDPLSIGTLRVNKRWCLSRYTPLLMVKPPYSKQPYSKSTRQVSLIDIPKTICEYAINNESCSQYEGIDLLDENDLLTNTPRQILIAKGDEDIRKYSYFEATDIGRLKNIEAFFSDKYSGSISSFSFSEDTSFSPYIRTLGIAWSKNGKPRIKDSVAKIAMKIDDQNYSSLNIITESFLKPSNKKIVAHVTLNDFPIGEVIFSYHKKNESEQLFYLPIPSNLIRKNAFNTISLNIEKNNLSKKNKLHLQSISFKCNDSPCSKKQPSLGYLD